MKHLQTPLCLLGSIGGYSARGGIKLKKTLLKIESMKNFKKICYILFFKLLIGTKYEHKKN